MSSTADEIALRIDVVGREDRRALDVLECSEDRLKALACHCHQIGNVQRNMFDSQAGHRL